MKQNESFLQKYYKNSTPESFSTILILKNILKNILPDNAASSNFNPGVKGVFTVWWFQISYIQILKIVRILN